VIKHRVEELIEESYLLSLSEMEIRRYLRNFLDACETILKENISIQGDIRIIGVKIALLKVRLLLREWAQHSVKVPTVKSEGEDKKAKSNVELLAQQVVDIKRLILNLFNSINPKLKEAVVEEEKNRKSLSNKSLQRFSTLNKNVTSIGYYLLLLVTIFILVVFLFY
jgi:hypothetical protein